MSRRQTSSIMKEMRHERSLMKDTEEALRGMRDPDTAHKLRTSISQMRRKIKALENEVWEDHPWTPKARQ